MTPTAIEWATWVWNFLRGCSRISEGCTNCYAERTALRFSGKGLAYEGLARRAPNGEARWTGDVAFIQSKLDGPLRRQKPERIFANSMSDLFHQKVPFEVIAAAFGIMACAPQHTFMLLTKRPLVALSFFRWLAESPDGPLARALHEARKRSGHRALVDLAVLEHAWKRGWPLANVQLGVSVEDAATLNDRGALLGQLPAWTRWMSYEPALAGIDVAPFLPTVVLSSSTPAPAETVHAIASHRRLRAASRGDVGTGKVDWIVCGGESGADGRPFDIGWAQSVVRACARSAVPVFVKQLGRWPYDGADFPLEEVPMLKDMRFRVTDPDGKKRKKRPWLDLQSLEGRDPSEWPAALRVFQYPAPIGDREAADLSRAVSRRAA